jgi:hypothetical protein
MRTRSGFEYNVARTGRPVKESIVQKATSLACETPDKRPPMAVDPLAGYTKADLISIFKALKAGKIDRRTKSGGYHFGMFIAADLKTSPFVKPHIKVYEQGKKRNKRTAVNRQS